MNGLRVLIAGTSSSYLEISKKLLKFHYDNCEVEFAYSGRDCLEKALQNPYDIILFDNDLDENNGLDLIDSIHKGNKQASLVIMIEHGEELKAARSLEHGATDYILKEKDYLNTLPFTVRKILRNRTTSSGREDTSRYRQKAKRLQLKEPSKGYFVLDRKGRILSVNAEMEHLTRYTEDELLELAFADLLPDDQVQSFYEWMDIVNADGQSSPPLRTEIFDKTGHRIPLDISLTAIRDEHENILSYRGEVMDNSGALEVVDAISPDVDQLSMLRELSGIITTSYDDPLSLFLEKIVELACHTFRFQRSTLALLDKRKKMFIKQALIGYHKSTLRDKRNLEVPQEIIERIFENRFRVKVIYYNQDHRDSSKYLNASRPDRRTQARRPPSKWHDRDLVMVNLINRNEQTFGYISLDKPYAGNFPNRDSFHNLELFGQLVSMAIENYYQFSEVEKQSRRLKQILVTSNIFKLYLSLSELLKEVVWSVRFSLDFKLVALGLISKRTGNLELKAVACDDKLKTTQLKQLAFPISALAKLMRPEYSTGKSYVVLREEEVVRPLKEIYFGQKVFESVGQWPAWGLLLVPIKSREGKVIGVLMVDDPNNKKIPSKETLRTLEIIANQIAVAVDNRILYAQAKSKLNRMQKNGRSAPATWQDEPVQGIRRFIDRFFK